MTEGVVLLHGMRRSAWSMRGLERFLQRHGYRTLNPTYPSYRHDIATLSEGLADPIAAFAASVDTVHFIGHSMGGLLIRHHLARHRPPNLGRVVQLASPNHGSELADYFHRDRWFRWFYGPAGQQLVTQWADREAMLPAPDYPLGVLVGDRQGFPYMSRKIAPPHDGMVSVASAKLAGMADHRVLSTDHTWIMQHAAARDYCLHFLKNGQFPA